MSVKVTVTGSQLAVALMSERQREEIAKELQRIEDEYLNLPPFEEDDEVDVLPDDPALWHGGAREVSDDTTA